MDKKLIKDIPAKESKSWPDVKSKKKPTVRIKYISYSSDSEDDVEIEVQPESLDEAKKKESKGGSPSPARSSSSGSSLILVWDFENEDVPQEHNDAITYRCPHCPNQLFATAKDKIGHRLKHKLKKQLKIYKERKTDTPTKEGKSGGQVGNEIDKRSTDQEMEIEATDFEKNDDDKPKTGDKDDEPNASGSESCNSGATEKMEKVEVDEETYEWLEEEQRKMVELTEAASMATMYFCKLCRNTWQKYFREEERKNHKKLFHPKDKQYNVQIHQDEYVVVLCAKCPRLAIPVDEWELHLKHHMFATVFFV